MKKEHQQTSIQAKLLLSFGLVVAATLANSVYATVSARNLREQLSNDIAGATALLDNARQVTIGISNMRSAMRGVTLFSLQHDDAQVFKARTAFETTAAQMRTAIGEMSSRNLSAADRASVAEIQSALDQWTRLWPHFAEMCTSGHGDQANVYALANMTPVMDLLQKNAAELGRASRAREDEATRSVDADVARSVVVNIMIAAVILLIGAGTFTKVSGLVRSLKQIAQSVTASAWEIANAASHVASASDSLAQQASQQAAALEETSASSEEISTTTRRNTENTQNTAAIVTQTSGKIADTNQALERMVSAMNQINESGDKISKIIKVIDEIAFQTNLLALNAAVEAARAGEAGQGFAIVADEVRNLAQRCAQAARDTSGLIEDTAAKSRAGKAQVDQVAEAMRGITTDSLRVKDLVAEVSSGGHQQLLGIEQIAKALSQMEQGTQKVAANAEESAAAAQQLQAQSAAMNSVVAQLSAMTGTGDARRAA